jgi:hypothetical protein
MPLPMSRLERWYVRTQCWLYAFAAPFRPLLTEEETLRRMVEWARREGERYRAGKG